MKKSSREIIETMRRAAEEERAAEEARRDALERRFMEVRRGVRLLRRTLRDDDGDPASDWATRVLKDAYSLVADLHLALANAWREAEGYDAETSPSIAHLDALLREAQRVRRRAHEACEEACG